MMARGLTFVTIVSLTIIAASALPQGSGKDSLKEMFQEPIREKELANLDKNLLQTQHDTNGYNNFPSTHTNNRLSANDGDNNQNSNYPGDQTSVANLNNISKTTKNGNNANTKTDVYVNTNVNSTTNTNVDSSSSHNSNKSYHDEHNNITTVINKFPGSELQPKGAHQDSVSQLQHQQESIVKPNESALGVAPLQSSTPPTSPHVISGNKLSPSIIEALSQSSHPQQHLIQPTQAPQVKATAALQTMMDASATPHIGSPASAPRIVILNPTPVASAGQTLVGAELHVLPSAESSNQLFIEKSTSQAGAAPTLVSAPGASHIAVAGSKPVSALAPHVDYLEKLSTIKKPTQKFELYMKPICTNVKVLTEKQLHRIQLQLAQFGAHTDGKTCACFKNNFGIADTSKVTVNDLDKICSAYHAPNQDVIESFKKCLADNWQPILDKEIERIVANRINCSKSHMLTTKDNSKTSFSINKLSHDDDEISMLEEIVAQVAENELRRESESAEHNFGTVVALPQTTVGPTIIASTLFPKHVGSVLGAGQQLVILSQPLAAPALVVASPTSEKPIPIISTSSKSTLAPSQQLVTVKSVKFASSTAPSSSVVSKNIAGTNNDNYSLNVNNIDTRLNNSNNNITVVSFEVVDNALKPVTTAPEVLAITTKKPVTTTAPVVVISAPTAASFPSTIAPFTVLASLPTTSTTAAPTKLTSTKAPVATVVAESGSSHVSAPTVVEVKNSTTKAPSVKKVLTSTGPTIVEVITIDPEATTEKPKKTVIVANSVHSTTTSNRPAVQLGQTTTTSKKVKVEDKAQKAIKDLISQRQIAKKGAIESHEHESRLHQIEHERQMSIDPIGHTVKHQKYEAAKEQKLKALRAQLNNGDQ